jgi:hypothetical protein
MHFKMYPETMTTFLSLGLGLDLVGCLGCSDIQINQKIRDKHCPEY